MLPRLPCKKRHPVLFILLDQRTLYFTFLLYSLLFTGARSSHILTCTYIFPPTPCFPLSYLHFNMIVIVGNNDKARNASTFSSWFSRPLLLQHYHYRSLTFVPAPCKWRLYGEMTRQWLMVDPVPQVVYWLYCWVLTWFLSTSDDNQFDCSNL